MFGKNEIVGKKYFEDKAGDKIFVTTVFYTLQGEGPFRGHPAIFVRLAKCNLACSFCDTWFDSGDWLSLDDIYEKIQNAITTEYSNGVPDWLYSPLDGQIHCGLVITGGEPMLQKNLTNLLKRFENVFDWMQIESNGTLLQELTAKTTLVCSPKCSEKNGKPLKYLNPKSEVLERADCLKFVMSADPDSPYNLVPDWALEWKQKTGKPIFVSPMNMYNKEPERKKLKKDGSNSISLEERSTVNEKISFWDEGLLDMKQNQKNHEYVAKYCMEHGCILNLQLHLYTSLA